jgi:ribosomal protein S18 acetylase RimI-like enzyme
MDIREIQPGEAEHHLIMLNKLDRESDYMLFEPGERKTTVDEMRERLSSVKKTDHAVIFGAVEAGEIVGFIEGLRGTVSRNRYCCSLVIGLLKAYRGKGTGRRLMEKLEEWAIERGVRRIELTVVEHNRPAMLLYSRCGFQVEGMRKHSLYAKGAFMNEFYMAKLIDVVEEDRS